MGEVRNEVAPTLSKAKEVVLGKAIWGKKLS